MPTHAAAVRHLKQADPVLRRIIEREGPCQLRREYEKDQFGALVDAIIYQQLAYKAAATIAGRFRQIYAKAGDTKGRLPTPAQLAATPTRKLRSAGLSRQKIGYLRDLARKAAAGSLKLGRFDGMTDSEVAENVTQVKGIGPWTADMFNMFSLNRPDVLPVGDLGLQYGIKEAYKLRKLPSPQRMLKMAEPWRPYRSVATWYLWQSRRK